MGDAFLFSLLGRVERGREREIEKARERPDGMALSGEGGKKK